MLSLFAISVIFTSIDSVPTVEAKYVFSKKWGTLGSGNGEFKSPEGIAIDSSGRVYVADTGNNRIQQFRLANPCPSGTSQTVSGVCFVRAWGSLGTGNGQFNKPLDVALDSSGLVYVADAGNNRIQMFKGNGAFVKAWSSDGPGTTKFESVVGVALDIVTNDIYVAEGTIPGHIHKFRLANPCPTSLTVVMSGICFVDKWTFGRHVSHPADDLETISGVAVNPLTSQVYVSDYVDVQVPGDSSFDRYSIIKNTADGNILSSWDGAFMRPAGVYVGPTGLVYVIDTVFSRVHMFQIIKPISACPDGTTKVIEGVCYVTKWGGAGSADGMFGGPRDIAVGEPTRNVYVADTGNNRIQVFYWKTDVGGPGGDGNLPGTAVK
ncbi:MAG TPA: hypothetical protein VJS91_03910 [Nitrososphaeraceae archaeon]|nr:hypothetical protein [Nitrososphaeraceae archaeon]